jgi:hypothetical protein
MSELRITPGNVGRAILILPLGAALIALGLGLGEHVARPVIRVLFGSPHEEPCGNTWSQEAHWLAEVASGTAAAAAAAGALLGRRRRDGWLYFNTASMIPAYWAYAHLVTGDYGSTMAQWSGWNWLVQGVLVWTLHPWLFERTAAWRRGQG